MGTVEELLERVQAWARTETNVRAAFVVGSQARSETPADEWSDVDVVLLADDPARLIEEADWLGEFGTPQLSFVEETAIGKERERRVLYEAGVDVDFAIFPVAALPALLSAPDAARAIARGYLIVHDEIRSRAGISQAELPSRSATASRARSCTTSGTTRSGPRRSCAEARRSLRAAASSPR